MNGRTPWGPPPAVRRISSITEVPADDWDRLLGPQGSLYLSHAWLRWAETDRTFETSYLLAAEGPRLLGALPCYQWEPGTDSVNSWYDPHRVLVRPHLPASSGAAWSPAALLGSRSGYHSDVLLDACLSPEERDAVMRALIERARRDAGAAGVRTVAMMYAPQPEARTVARVAGIGARSVPTSAAAVLNVRWGSFEEYLGQFGRNRRTSIRREISTFEAAGVRVRSTCLGESYQRIGPLLGRLQRKYGFADTDAEMTARLEAQAVTLDSASRVFLELSGDRLVGFCLAYQWQDRLYVRSTGFDPDPGAAAFDYFNLVVYGTLRHAIEHRLSSVHLGLSSYRGKVARGAALSPLWSVVWHPGEAAPEALKALDLPAEEAVEAEELVPGTFTPPSADPQYS